MRKTNLRQGMSLAEILLAMMLTILLVATVAVVSAWTTRSSKNVEGEITKLSKNRVALQILEQDVKDASAFLARYPTSGTATFIANETDTLILKEPIMAGADFSSSAYKVVIYKLESADGNPPFKLNRYIADCGSDEPEPTLDTVVFSNARYMSMSFNGKENFVGDGYTVTWGLRGTPAGDVDGSPQYIKIAGHDWSRTEYAHFDTTSIVFERAPKWGMPIDVSYNVDPSVAMNWTGANPATMVSIQLGAKVISKNARQQDYTRNTEFAMTTELRNK